MASRKQTLEQALKTLRDPDGTGRTTLSHGFSGKPLEQVSGPPNETATPAYRNGYAAGLAFARGTAAEEAAVVEAAMAVPSEARDEPQYWLALSNLDNALAALRAKRGG